MTTFDAIRRPEYTGDRRCWPCTVLNLGVVAVLGGAVAILSPMVGLAVVVLGVALVVLRGYVVPFTPRFAPVLASRLPWSFGHRAGSRGPTADWPGSFAATADVEPSSDARGDRAPASDASDDPGTDPDAVLAALAEADVVVGGDEDLVLDRSFESDWEARMADLRPIDDDALAAAAAAAAPWDATGEPFEDRIRVRGEGRDVWLSRPAAIAETAAVEALVDAGLDPGTAAPAARPLRMFLRECPACGGPVVETTRESCCGATAGSLNPAATVLACEDCEAELFELEPVEDGADGRP